MINIEMVRVIMVREANPKYEVAVRSPQDVNKLIYELIGHEDREHFIVLMLDAKNQVNAIHTVSIGTLNAGLVHPREVYKAIFLNNSASVIFAHNHPSGSVEPSPEDVKVTQRLVEVGELVGVEVMDHVIVGGEHRFLSMKEKGLI